MARTLGALVITGVFFGLMEVRHYRQQRQETASIELNRPTMHEWFQWLSECLDEHPEYRDAEGAYSKYIDWKPETGNRKPARESIAPIEKTFLR